MSFAKMSNLLRNHFNEMLSNNKYLFKVDLDKDYLYNLYLDSIPVEKNRIFKVRRTHDCSCCRNFIKNIGNVVSINNGVIDTIWNIKTDSDTYQPVLDALDSYVRSKTILNVFLPTEKSYGTPSNYTTCVINDKEITFSFSHFSVDIPASRTYRKFEKNEMLSNYTARHDVFKRGIEEFTIEALDCVIELSSSNDLYRGQTWLDALKEFRSLKEKYTTLSNDREKELFFWENSVSINNSTAMIRNTSIGQLLTRLSKGEDLNTAINAYEVMVAPTNYRRSKPVYTTTMLNKAKEEITNLGLIDALPRRHANIDDITINDILFADKNVSNRITGADDIFSKLNSKAVKNSSPKKFSNVHEISINDFLNDVLPTANSLEVFLDNTNKSNMVSLIAPKNKDVKSMFTWGNNFTWAYTGNITDSMKERVKSFGGKVTGDLRMTLQWNEDGMDNVDLDAHCLELCGGYGKEEIYFGNKKSSNGGMLDVDIISPERDISGNDKTAVENIIYSSKTKMKKGTYKFFINQYSGSTKNGFRAEVEFDGKIYSFNYSHSMRTGENVDVAEITYDGNTFSIKELLPSTCSTGKVWNLDAMAFIPVSVVCYSPNYWSTAKTNVGHKHIFFMLKDCINPENPSGIFNEFLVSEFHKHRHVMEAIGNEMRVESTDDQLSGLGFALDKRAELIVKVIGATERVLKIKF